MTKSLERPRERLENSTRVVLSIEKEEWKEVHRRAKAAGVTASAWMRAAIKLALEK